MILGSGGWVDGFRGQGVVQPGCLPRSSNQLCALWDGTLNVARMTECETTERVVCRAE